MRTIALNVPRARKDEAKALGARWNGFKKTWYVKVGTDLSPFKALGFYDVTEPAEPATTTASSPTAITAAAAPVPAPRTLSITREHFLGLTLDNVTDFDDLETLIKTEDHGLFTGTWHYENGTIVDRMTIRPYNDTAEAFYNKQVMPWGKSRSYDLPAMIAEGIEIILEDIVFADETPTA